MDSQNASVLLEALEILIRVSSHVHLPDLTSFFLHYSFSYFNLILFLVYAAAISCWNGCIFFNDSNLTNFVFIFLQILEDVNLWRLT